MATMRTRRRIASQGMLPGRSLRHDLCYPRRHNFVGQHTTRTELSASRGKHCHVLLRPFQPDARNTIGNVSVRQAGNILFEATRRDLWLSLAPVVQDKAEAAYAHSDLFERRRRLLSGWTAYLDGVPRTDDPQRRLHARIARDPGIGCHCKLRGRLPCRRTQPAPSAKEFAAPRKQPPATGRFEPCALGSPTPRAPPAKTRDAWATGRSTDPETAGWRTLLSGLFKYLPMGGLQGQPFGTLECRDPQGRSQQRAFRDDLLAREDRSRSSRRWRANL